MVMGMVVPLIAFVTSDSPFLSVVSVDGSAVAASAELESRVTAQVEAIVESRLNAVEEHIKEQVDQRMEEMETRMSGKLDAIFALLQNSQKPS